MPTIRLHPRERGLHGLGIEYNWERENWNRDGQDFVLACHMALDREYGWFHQCGWNPNKGTFEGYQFFEMLGCNDEDMLFEQAQRVADTMGLELTV